MIKSIIVFICSSILCYSNSYASDADTTHFVEMESEMNNLMHDILSNPSDKIRASSSQSLQYLMDSTLRLEGAYNFKFSKLKGVSILQPSDNSFRIFSWQLYLDKSNYRYAGFIQTRNGAVYPLKDRSDDMRSVEFSVLKPQNWYGALYYNLKSFKHNGQTMYLLFGYDAYDFYNKRKLLDILYFDKNGQAKFGQDVIEMKDGFGRKRMVKRFLLEYSASVNVSLNFSDEMNMIIYDHLIYGQPIKAAGPSNVPDGSYCGLKLSKDGIWQYIDKVHQDDPSKILVDATTYEKMIGTEKKRKAKKDIFGRSK